MGDTIQDKAREFLTPHLHRYKELMHAAREAAETTSTPMWAANFHDKRTRHYTTERHAMEAIKTVSQVAIDSDYSEDHGKAIKDALKDAEAERIAWTAYYDNAVLPYKTAATAVTECIERAIREADRVEEQHTLTHRGLMPAVEQIVSGWARCSFDEKTGAVTIQEPHQDAAATGTE